MAKKETMYSVIFDIYELKDGTKQQKETYRKLIKRRFEKFFPDESLEEHSPDESLEEHSLDNRWKKLSPLEKDKFVYIDIKEDIFERYVGDKNKKENISKKIDEKLKTIFEDRVLAEHNKKVFNEYRTDYYNPEDSDTPKRKAYDEFCKDLFDINNLVPRPSYDEWVQWNEKAIKVGGTPLRIYDYIKSYYNDLDLQKDVSQAEVDHVVIEILRKFIDEEWGIEINIPKIRECLSFIKNNEFNEFERVATKDDDFLEMRKSISEEEWQKYITNKAQYYNYMEMLRKLDFYVERKMDGKG